MRHTSLVLLVVVMVLISACSPPAAPTAKPTAPVAPSDPPASPVIPEAEFTHVHLLIDEYENEIKADGQYLGKYVKVTGHVREIGKESDGRYYVSLSFFSPTKETSVIGYVSEKHLEQFAKLKPERTATLIGKVAGRKAENSAFRGFVVVLEDCRPPE